MYDRGMENHPDNPHKSVGAVRSPLTFNAFSITSIGAVISVSEWSGKTPPIAWAGFAFMVALTGWVNWQAKTDPRSQAYGGSEYVEESKLAKR
jgi:hypothetical protein